MIFPDIRLSELRRDADARRIAFDRTQNDFVRVVKKKFSPLNILKEHPQLWMGAAMSLLSANRIGKLLGLVGLMRNGHANGNRHSKKSGIIGKLFRFGSRTAVRTVMPMAMAALNVAVKAALKAVRSRHS